MADNKQLVEFLKEIASDHDLVGNLAPDDEARQLHKRSARKVRKLVERVALKGEQFKLERTIASGGQRIARQKGLIARIERLGRDSKHARELLAVLEQTQSLFEQKREHIKQMKRPRRRQSD